MGIYESVPATPEEVEAFASDLTDTYLRCRVWGHDPVEHDAVTVRDVKGHPTAYWDITLRCAHRCGVRWRVLTNADFDVLSRSLDYSNAPGYLHEGSRIDKKGKSILRKHKVERFVQGQAAKAPAKKTSKRGKR